MTTVTTKLKTSFAQCTQYTVHSWPLHFAVEFEVDWASVATHLDTQVVTSSHQAFSFVDAKYFQSQDSDAFQELLAAYGFGSFQKDIYSSPAGFGLSYHVKSYFIAFHIIQSPQFLISSSLG